MAINLLYRYYLFRCDVNAALPQQQSFCGCTLTLVGGGRINKSMRQDERHEAWLCVSAGSTATACLLVLNPNPQPISSQRNVANLPANSELRPSANASTWDEKRKNEPKIVSGWLAGSTLIRTSVLLYTPHTSRKWIVPLRRAWLALPSSATFANQEPWKLA